ncbi:PE family protein [Mycobacterium intermedium]|uniref:PE family protein n=1 Tax=Mycobacterium intermedium TaxID=28445 RepID=A0A1E3SHC2_MYCIE|nr:PE family protein [Mycobacterium intermedium]ODR01540.1 hypothetical protein BHQ20_08645 [Mycobacterium intermedium]OPE50295.1 PE family protein [Mycobacterium intermedium]ORA97685.1 PE family protein [Mycobacterium intermedium]
MSWVIAAPEYVAQAATELAGIATSLSAANAQAAFPTSGVLAAGADEVSVALSALFNAHAQAYQAVSQQAALFHQQFVNLMSGGAEQYALTEAANELPMQVVGQALGAAATPAAAAAGEAALVSGGGPAVGSGAVGAAAVQSGSHGGFLYGNGAVAAPGAGAAASAGLLGKGGAGGLGAGSHGASPASPGSGHGGASGGWLTPLANSAGVVDIVDAGAAIQAPAVAPTDASGAVPGGLLLAPAGVGVAGAHGGVPSGASNGNQSSGANALSTYGNHSGWLYGDGGALGPYDGPAADAAVPASGSESAVNTSAGAGGLGGLRGDAPLGSGGLYAGTGGFAAGGGAGGQAVGQAAD